MVSEDFDCLGLGLLEYPKLQGRNSKSPKLQRRFEIRPQNLLEEFFSVRLKEKLMKRVCYLSWVAYQFPPTTTLEIPDVSRLLPVISLFHFQN